MRTSLDDQLLHASLLCGMRPQGDPVYRLQLFFVANKHLGSKSHQADFQRALETGVDSKKLWENYREKGTGEYQITQHGFASAKSLYGDVQPVYQPTRASDFRCRIQGHIGGIEVIIQTRGKRPKVFLDGNQSSSAKQACETLEAKAGLSLPTASESGVRVLYNMAVDRSFTFVWEGETFTDRTTEPRQPAQPERVMQVTYRIPRDTALAREVKHGNAYLCQICSQTLRLGGDKRYAEAHHIKPLGSPHNGLDVRGNILCVCPNHHVLLDYGAIKLDAAQLGEIDVEYIDYYNEHIFGKA